MRLNYLQCTTNQYNIIYNIKLEDYMLFTAAFRYKGREYYVELPEGKEVSFGSHKKDQIQIPDRRSHMLWLRAKNDNVQIAAQAPLSAPYSEFGE